MATGSQIRTEHFPLSKGLDQRVYKRHLQAPALVRCNNARFTRSGSLTKRPGNEVLAAVGTSPKRLVVDRTELLEIDALAMRSYSTKAADYIERGAIHEAVPSMEFVASPVRGATQADENDINEIHADVAYANSMIVYAWAERHVSGAGAVIAAVVLDATTRTQIQAPEIVITDSVWSFPRLVVANNTIIVLAARSGALSIAARVLSADGTSWGTQTSIITDCHGDVFYDVATNGTNFYVLYKDTSDDIRCRSFNSSLVAQATQTSTEAATNTEAFGITVTAGERVWFTYGFDDGGTYRVRAGAFSENLGGQTIAPFNIYGGISESVTLTAPIRLSSTTACCVFNVGTAQNNVIAAPVFNTSGAIVGNATPAGRSTDWCQLASKPFIEGTKTYAWVYSGGARFNPPTPPTDQLLQYSLTLVDLGTDDTTTAVLLARPVTQVATRFAYQRGVDAIYQVVCTASHAYEIASDEWICASVVLRSNNGRVGVVEVKADFAHSNIAEPANCGGTMHLVPGGTYDGSISAETNFCYWPQEVEITSYEAGGDLDESAYRWRYLFMWTDGRGQIHRSAPSDYTEGTVTAGNGSAVLRLAQLSLVHATKAEQVSIEIYRTTVDPTDATPYYLVATIANSPYSGSASFTDDIADSAIITQPQIYTQGGAKRRVQPPGFQCHVGYRGRIFGAHGNTLWYSGAYVEGEAPWFSDEFTQPLDTTDPITALWVMDDTLFISTAKRIYYMQAEGPADNGAQNDIGMPLRIATDYGCIEPRSVVTIPVGTLYQSAIGIQLLSRGRQVTVSPTIFGARVQDTLAEYPTIVSATVHPDGGYVVFFCRGGDSAIRIIYDYTADEWCTDSSSLFGTLKSSVVYDDTLHWLNESNTYVETDGYLDEGAWVTRTIELAEFHPTGVQGLMKLNHVQVMGELFTDHGLTFDFYKDYAEEDPFDTRTFSDTEVAALVLEQVGVAPVEQRCQSMRLKITDTTPTEGDLGDGQGCELSAVSFDFDPLGNQFQLPAAARK